MTCLLINLDRATERLEVESDLFAGAGIPFERVAGVDAREMSDREAHAACPRVRFYLANARRVKRGEIGCMRSHQLCWRRALEPESGPRTAIFEDDVTFDGAAMREVLAQCAADDDGGRPTVWLFQSNMPPSAQPVTGDWYDLRSIPNDIGRCWGAFSYAVNPAAARRLLRLTTPMANVNDAWSTFARCGIRVRLTSHPPSCTVRKEMGSMMARKPNLQWRIGWLRRFYQFRYRWAIRLDILLKKVFCRG